MKKRRKSLYSCQSCGYQTPKWMGRCPECGGWDTLVEEVVTEGDRFQAAPSATRVAAPEPESILSIETLEEPRMPSGIPEFDRVLGGGIVAGSLVLIGGDPGIGKSTLMLQALDGLAQNGRRVLYVSGEESKGQIHLRSQRLGVSSGSLLVVTEIHVDAILALLETQKPAAVVIDSVQTMYNAELASAPGSVGQVRETTMKLMVAAKKSGIPIFLVGHVTKDGAIAGPRVMEHMVDTVLYFEGDTNHIFRVLRAVKNRFGSTNEIGVFEMRGGGLAQVPNPSALFLAERPESAPGSVVTASMEGTRPILVEIQGLVSRSGLGTPRRTVLGLDSNRVALLVAVMEKKIGMNLAGLDIFMNVAGGVRITEPAVDPAILAAAASSFLDRPLPEGAVVLGEVGLTGEVRGISQLEGRAAEIRKMGFTHFIVPESGAKRLKKIDGLKVTGVRHVAQAMEILF